MNHIYKTVWNAARGQYIASNEAHKSHNRGKSALVLAVAAASMLCGTFAQAAYVEQGKLGDKASWESVEYKKQWGLEAINASSAYAMGYNGKGIKIAVMDSGVLQSHPELNTPRITVTHVTGIYGSSGFRYPQQDSDKGEYRKGDKFDVNGAWMSEINDAHGSGVTGVMGANRDGYGTHGVAWAADIVSGNSGGTDNTNYGPFLDHDFFYAGWKALADDLVATNGAKRGGVINNSFGTNARIVEQEGVVGADGGKTAIHLTARTVADSEYEYFYSNKKYNGAPSFVDGAWEAIKGTNVVQVMTTGNRDMENPFYRPNYPYFNPEAEDNWIAVAGVRLENRDDLNNRAKPLGKIDLRKDFNEAGTGKWWTISGPADRIISPRLNADKKSPDFGKPIYKTANGTSSAAPHVTACIGVLMPRYEQMNAIQVRNVLFTTATHKNKDGSNFTSWTAPEGEVDVRFGWGMPDLDKALYGPGQLFGRFDYDMAANSLDVWTNDISDIALKQREREDKAWMAASANGTKIEAGGGYTLGDGFVVRDGDDDDTNHIISLDDAKKWRADYYKLRAEAVQKRIDGGLYRGSLVKRGEGTLVLTGDNNYEGGTTVEGGTLLGFTESFGTKAVEVNGGSFGLLAKYNDELTKKGELKAKGTHLADINVNNGGKLLVAAGETVKAGKVVFKKGAVIALSDADLKAVYNGKAVTGTLEAASVEGLDLVKADDSLVFFKTTVETTKSAGKTLVKVTIKRDEAVSMSSIGKTDAQRAIGADLEAASKGAAYKEVVGATLEQAGELYDMLGNEVELVVKAK